MFNKKLGHKDGFLNCIDKGDTPLHTLHMDHVGPMDATAKQYKYVLTTTSGEETLRKLEVWSSIFGNPARVISDRGSAFTSQIFSEHLKKNGIDHVVSTTGVPREQWGNDIVSFIDDCKFTVVYLLRTKAEVYQKFREYEAMVCKVWCAELRCDNGGE
ncbi:uncharacterized protein LOC120907873 [Anopheles arabiensis]|uniref:uncharacterized protein LOC120907873 n=1 Tax=Anopheles arabiensis TaxID=7173 RepID=UPI001AADFB50|nr:uncharacterized protein LOC120907873 [Anopheles arabiensis]